MKETIFIVLFFAVYIAVIFYIIKIVIDTVFDICFGLLCLNQRKKTIRHYYNRDDVYLDFEKNQWFSK